MGFWYEECRPDHGVEHVDEQCEVAESHDEMEAQFQGVAVITDSREDDVAAAAADNTADTPTADAGLGWQTLDASEMKFFITTKKAVLYFLYWC